MSEKTLMTSVLLASALCLFGCPNQVDPGPDAGTENAPDGGTSAYVLENANLAPAAQAGESETYRIRGRLRQTTGQKSETENYEMRGGLVPAER